MPLTKCHQCGGDVDIQEFVCPHCEGPGPAWRLREEFRKRDRSLRYCFLAAGIFLLALFVFLKW